MSQPAVFLVRAGLLIVWLQLNVSGFRPVLARGWHGPRLSMRTTGAALLAVERCVLNVPVAVLLVSSWNLRSGHSQLWLWLRYLRATAGLSPAMATTMIQIATAQR